MENIRENKIIADVIKKNEQIMSEYLQELQKGLREKSLGIDGIEALMIKTLENMRHNVVTGTNEMMSEESKKKLLLAVAEHAERERLLRQKKATVK